MYRDIAVRAAVFVVFVIAWLACGGSATLLWPTMIVVGAGLALHAWAIRHARDSNGDGPSWPRRTADSSIDQRLLWTGRPVESTIYFTTPTRK
ncbi:hypothetical protein ACFYUV_09930 [Nonomuraea sp. NPDC003560]|uniref:hypothetical protein n=1 Tax=Nonomuraea sp. NPDC003560 TaxID=3364341 RepID=UPI0036D09230